MATKKLSIPKEKEDSKFVAAHNFNSSKKEFETEGKTELGTGGPNDRSLTKLSEELQSLATLVRELEYKLVPYLSESKADENANSFENSTSQYGLFHSKLEDRRMQVASIRYCILEILERLSV